MNVLIFVVGLAVLIKSADFLVQGGASVAKRLGVSPLVVGLTIIAFGTSLPELLVTMISGLRNNADLAVANLIGSNIANVLVVLGIAAIIRPLPVHDSTVVSEVPFSLIAALLVGFLANAALFSSTHELSISRLDGGILLFFFFLFMLYIYKVSREKCQDFADDGPKLSSARAAAYIIAGVVGLFFGGGWVVDGAVGIALLLGVDDALIGLTIVALGTSLPELVASAVAAYRNQTDIAVGNVVGSNIFNGLFVLPVSGLISAVDVPDGGVADVLVSMAFALLLVSVFYVCKARISRLMGVVLLLCYALYVLVRLG